MYDQSLEQLIDAVIADGVITDQERKVVYTKAASLGIDQDEIEVYLNGRLDKLGASSSKSTKHGTIRTCPNCGANIGSFVGKCPECGHEFSSIENNSVVKELMDRLDKVDKEKRPKRGGRFSSDDPEREAEDKKAEIISLFPVPNTKNDLIEFATLCKTGLKSYSDTSSIYDAWRGKAAQIVDKAKILFPNDKDVEKTVKSLKKDQNNFFKNHSLLLGFVLFFAIIGAIFLGVNAFNNSQQEYTDSLIEQISQLPTPDAENYLDCYRQFSNIVWTKGKKNNGWDELYSSFVQAQNDYKALLISAFKAAGVKEKDLPISLKDEDSDLLEFEAPEAEINEAEIEDLYDEN